MTSAYDTDSGYSDGSTKTQSEIHKNKRRRQRFVSTRDGRRSATAQRGSQRALKYASHSASTRTKPPHAGPGSISVCRQSPAAGLKKRLGSRSEALACPAGMKNERAAIRSTRSCSVQPEGDRLPELEPRATSTKVAAPAVMSRRMTATLSLPVVLITAGTRSLLLARTRIWNMAWEGSRDLDWYPRTADTSG